MEEVTEALNALREEVGEHPPHEMERVRNELLCKTLGPEPPRGELPARSWLKLQEMINYYGLLDSAKTFAELGAAPGSMTRLLCRKGLRGTCVTLGRMDRVEGADVLEGDVFFQDVRARFVARCRTSFPGGVDLAFSDMARHLPKDALNAQEQLHLAMFEYAVLSLHSVIRDGGNMVIKIFGALCESTQRKICDVAAGFRAAYLSKPLSSRPFNSEVYLVCIDRLATGCRSAVDKDAVKHSAHAMATAQVRCIKVLLERMKGGGEATLRGVLSPAVTSDDVGQSVQLACRGGGGVLKVGEEVRGVTWSAEAPTEGEILSTTDEAISVGTDRGPVTLRNVRAWRSYPLHRQLHAAPAA